MYRVSRLVQDHGRGLQRLEQRARAHEDPRQELHRAGRRSSVNFANFWRARSRLYQNEILQEKYAFDSILQTLQDVHTFAPLQSQNFSKNIFEKK